MLEEDIKKIRDAEKKAKMEISRAEEEYASLLEKEKHRLDESIDSYRTNLEKEMRNRLSVYEKKVKKLAENILKEAEEKTRVMEREGREKIPEAAERCVRFILGGGGY